MDGDVVFDAENAGAPRRSGQPQRELMTPMPKQDKRATEKVVLGVLGTLLIASIFVAVKTQPKEIVVLTPIDAPLINR